jgi:hypothetical protein
MPESLLASQGLLARFMTQALSFTPEYSMKTIARYAWAVAALGAGLFFLSGASPLAARTRFAEPAYDLLVVQSSTDRKLSPADLEQLHEAVARFLASRGPVRSGEYIVRIDFPPQAPGAAAEWMIVKLTNLPPPAFALVEDYSPAESGYDYPYDYGSAYSPYGSYDPFDPYFTGYYWPSAGIPLRAGGHWRGDRDDHNRDGHAQNDGRPDYKGKPGDRRPGDMSNRPRVTYTRIDDQTGAHRQGERDGRAHDAHPRNDLQPRHERLARTAENTLHSPEPASWRDTGSALRPSHLSGEQSSRNSFTPPPVRTPSPPSDSSSQRDKDAGNRKQER